jgi:putative ABC transport system permease protein
MIGKVVRMRGGALLGALVILATAATIAAGAGQIMATALGAPGPGRFAAADAVLRAHPSFRLGGENGDTVTVRRSRRLPTADIARVAAVPGVRTAVGDVAFSVAVAGHNGRPLATRGGAPAHGHGWDSASLTPYRLVSGYAPAGPQDVVLDAALVRAGRLHLGERLRITTPATAQTFILSGVALAPPAQRRAMSSVFFAPARARELEGFGPGVDAIAVRADPHTDQARLRARITEAIGGGATVLDHRHAAAADVGDPSAYDRIALVAVLASGAGLTLGIAILIVAGTIAFAVQGRRREIASLRVIGATPAQVRRALVAWTALAGVIGGALGCAVATGLMSVFVHALVAVGLAPHGFAVSPNWIPYAIALSTGPVVAAAATLVAARRTLTVAPGEALVETALPPRRMGIVRTVSGLLAAGGGVALVITLSHQALAFATLAASCFVLAIALLAPAVIGAPVALLARPLRAVGGAGFLAGSSLTAGRFRVGAAATGVALVVALTGTQIVALATAQRATRHTTAQRVRAAHILVATGGAGLPPAAAAAAARLPGVTTTAMTATQVYLLGRHLTNEGDGWQAAGLDPLPGRQTLALDVRSGSLAAVAGHGIAVSRALAATGHVVVGDTLRARLADGTPMSLTIAAVYDRAAGLGDVVLPSALARAHATSAADDSVFVAGGDPPKVRRELAAIARVTPGAAVIDRQAYLAQARAEDREDAGSEWVVDAMMILVAVLAAFNAGATAAAERRPELGLARLSGATRRQLTTALTLESLATTVAGIAAGALVTLVCFARAGHDPTSGPLALPLGQAGLVVGGAALLGVAGQLVPAGLARRPPLAELAADAGS